MSHLSTLDIDGRNFFNACQQNIDWTEILPAICNFSISHFMPIATRWESFKTSRLMRSLSSFNRLMTVHFNDLHLDESPGHSSYDFDLRDNTRKHAKY
jgi:hypothetical protein